MKLAGPCLHCSKPIVGRQATARFCCGRCSEAWHRRLAAKRKAKRRAQPNDASPRIC
jgi:hypothetical protein